MCDNCNKCPNYCCGRYETPEVITAGAVYKLVENNAYKGDVFMVGFNQVGDPVVHFKDNEFMQCFAVNADTLKRQ
jgi:hypothetical protein